MGTLGQVRTRGFEVGEILSVLCTPRANLGPR